MGLDSVQIGTQTELLITEVLDLYEKSVATNPNVERKGVTMPYTSLNGHMFSFLTKEGTLALRLPATERDAFLRQFKTALCEQNGRVLDEYVVVALSLLKNLRKMKKYFDLSYTHVASLKPKAAKSARGHKK